MSEADLASRHATPCPYGSGCRDARIPTLERHDPDRSLVNMVAGAGTEQGPTGSDGLVEVIAVHAGGPDAIEVAWRGPGAYGIGSSDRRGRTGTAVLGHDDRRDSRNTGHVGEVLQGERGASTGSLTLHALTVEVDNASNQTLVLSEALHAKSIGANRLTLPTQCLAHL